MGWEGGEGGSERAADKRGEMRAHRGRPGLSSSTKLKKASAYLSLSLFLSLFHSLTCLEAVRRCAMTRRIWLWGMSTKPERASP